MYNKFNFDSVLRILRCSFLLMLFSNYSIVGFADVNLVPPDNEVTRIQYRANAFERKIELSNQIFDNRNIT
ncbi:MAG: hypothetical protein ACC707_05115, partial [Thiohalomonadales bacterium]